ncbi:MAG: hypothetical protein Q7J31_05210 [Syntrophales bacterium]|nr:hypothetical protein [Syntrophales bacterium]
MKRLLKPLSLILLIVFAGCATIVGDKTHLMPINSVPSPATIKIVDETGSVVFKGETPTNVTLEKSTGKYWGKKSYTVTISKDGFETQTISITAKANGWYLGGNIIFGGLIGWFILDPFNGAMYNLTPDKIDVSIGKISSHNNTGTDGSITIVLLEDVPKHLRDKMVRIK